MFQRAVAERESRIFRDRRVFSDDFIPEDLPARRVHVEKIEENLSEALYGEPPVDLFLYGPPGTGKTACIKLVMGRLEAAARAADAPVRVDYVNCGWVRTGYRVMSRLCKSFDPTIPSVGLPFDELYETYISLLSEHRCIQVIVLDELDNLIMRSGDDLLYSLVRVNGDLNGLASVTLVCVSNSLTFMEKLDPKITSALNPITVRFAPYRASELREILYQRVELGFQPGAVDTEVVPYLAAFVAQESGDARKAIQLLRVAGEYAEQSKSEVVKLEHVKRARDQFERDEYFDLISALPIQRKAVLASVAIAFKYRDRHGRPAHTGLIYEIYKRICEKNKLDPLSMRSIRRVLKYFASLGLLEIDLVHLEGGGSAFAVLEMSPPPDEVLKILQNGDLVLS